MAVDLAVRSERRPAYGVEAPPLPSLYLPNGDLLCPCCERARPAWRYKTLQRNPKYAHLTNAVVKCLGCGHLFAPEGG